MLSRLTYQPVTMCKQQDKKDILANSVYVHYLFMEMQSISETSDQGMFA